jgi:rubredoxin
MEYKKYICLLCGWIYDEELGWSEDGIEPGTKWEDIPLTWVCPECGASKQDFEMIELEA